MFTSELNNIKLIVSQIELVKIYQGREILQNQSKITFHSFHESFVFYSWIKNESESKM